MTDLKWYWNRMRKMPAVELPHRVREAARKKADKLLRRLTVEPVLHTPLDVPEFPRKELRNILQRFEAPVIASCEDALRHRFDIFGTTVEHGARINWHLDTKSGHEWPRIFWGDISYRESSEMGGIKFAWELNRLHHLPRLALGYALRGNRAYRQEIFDQLGSWLAANPYPLGINWISGIELGIRIVNVFFVLRFLGVGSLDDAERALVVRFLYRHARHLQRYPSRYSSCANHALAEALGLFTAGLCLRQHSLAARWKRLGREVLEREVRRQIYPDGSSFEHTIPYLQFVADHFLVYHLLCDLYGEECGVAVEERLHSAIEFLNSVTDSRGNYPLIGDDDDGALVKLGFGDRNNIESLLVTGALRYDRPRWIRNIPEIDSKTLLLFGERMADRWSATKASAMVPVPREGTYFANAGLAVYRAHNGKREILFVGNSGPLGLTPLAGHGHADALSVWLSVDGRPLLVDTGTYRYHSGGKWRRYFRSTAAHNTVRVDGCDQAEIVSDFMFDNFYTVGGVQFRADETGLFWSASHDGYKRLADPVVHRRTVTMRADGQTLVVADQIQAREAHRVECFFHFHPGCSVVLNDEKVKARHETVGLDLELDGHWETKVLKRGALDPIAGWYSRTFNSLEETTTLVLGATVQGIVELRTSIQIEDYHRPDAVKDSPHPGASLEV